MKTIKDFLSEIRKYSNEQDCPFYFILKENDSLEYLPINTIEKDKHGNTLMWLNGQNQRKRESLTIKELIKKLSTFDEDSVLYFQKRPEEKDVRGDLDLYDNADSYDPIKKIVTYEIMCLNEWI